ncbi:MAG: hypothetical protein NW218_20720 [Saprospiraceae bacterium]|nr:hypothetical protein [Saprospiraceae bacterium]
MRCIGLTCIFKVQKEYLLLLVLVLPVLAWGQKKETASPAATSTVSVPLPPVADSAIQKLFNNSTALKWIKRLKGRIDDVYLVDIALGSDGRNCKGYLTYIKSKTRFQISGPLEKDQIVLEERDANNYVTGQIKGTFNGTRLEGSWSNNNNSLGSRIEAEIIQPGQTVVTSCAENKWACRYITRYNGGRADMVLIRMHNGALEGFLWVEADRNTYTLKGELKTDGTYDLEALLPNGKTGGLISGNLSNPTAITANWVGSGEKRSFSFSQKDKLVFGCLDYADYRSGFDAIYPRTACTACNTWLDQQVNGWMSACRTAVAAKQEPLNAASRSAHRGSCWSDIVCWTENILSGYLTFTDTWTPDAQGKSFNFNLKTGKEITLADLFVKSFNAKSWLDEYWKRESPKMRQFASDPAYREWINKVGFPLFALRRDGLELSTLFHPVYGQQHLLVPYADLKPYLRKDHPVAEFVK